MKTQIFFALALSCFASRALAISETNFAQVYAEQVAPFYESSGVKGSMIAADGQRLAYRAFEVANEKGVLVISSGRTESFIKYAELVHDLAPLGMSVYLLDHRGQGFSGRDARVPSFSYIDRVDTYVTDLKRFMDTVVIARKPTAKKFLLAHSMGSLVGALYLAKHPGDFTAAVLSSPMFGINTGKYPEALAYTMLAKNCILGQGRDLAPGQVPYDFNARFEDNVVTRSRPRFDIAAGLIARNPTIALGGSTNQWIKAGLEAGWKVGNMAKLIQTPVLLFMAGQDSLVRNDRAKAACARMNNCRSMVFENAHHEILNETDDIRDQALAAGKAFISSFLTQ